MGPLAAPAVRGACAAASEDVELGSFVRGEIDSEVSAWDRSILVN